MHTQHVSEESYSEPEFVPRYSLAQLKLAPGYKSGADPVCQAGSHCSNLVFFVFGALRGSFLNAKKNFKKNLWEQDSIAEMTEFQLDPVAWLSYNHKIDIVVFNKFA